MEVKVLFFAQIQELFKQDEMVVYDIYSVEELIDNLKNIAPNLSQYQYIVAVNEAITKENSALNNNDVVALLPPFAGG